MNARFSFQGSKKTRGARQQKSAERRMDLSATLEEQDAPAEAELNGGEEDVVVAARAWPEAPHEIENKPPPTATTIAGRLLAQFSGWAFNHVGKSSVQNP